MNEKSTYTKELELQKYLFEYYKQMNKNKVLAFLKVSSTMCQSGDSRHQPPVSDPWKFTRHTSLLETFRYQFKQTLGK